MKEFTYVINDPLGIHARPAGMLAKEAARFQSAVSVVKAGKKADAKKIFGLMGLAVKTGDEVTVQAEGADEEAACEALEAFFKANL